MQERNRLLGALVRDAERVATILDAEDLEKLSGTPADENPPTYGVVKARLMRYRATDPKIRFVYIFRADPASGRVVFLADSEPVGSPDISLPGDKLIALVPLRITPVARTALRPHFRLLVNKPAHHEALRSALATPVTALATPLPFAANNSFDLRVLLVEDNPVNQLLMQKVLGHLGCQWTVAENGQIALEELKRSDYHLVLMDLHMPVMDGHAAISRIRAGEAGESMRQVWITALTADARQEQKERVLEAGANDYLLKPVRLKDIDSMMRRFMAQRGPAGS